VDEQIDLLVADHPQILFFIPFAAYQVHFSALLSALGEQNVELALQVNCQGVQASAWIKCHLPL
jgi:hypothetical protein